MADDPSKLSAVELHSRDAVEFDTRYRTQAGFVERQAVWAELIARYSDPAHRALDLGCGSGELLVSLAAANREVTGLDGSAEMLELCRRKLGQRPNVTLVCADVAEAAHLPAGSFQLVVASSLLEYLEDLDATLADIHRLLAPGGVFILSLPNAASFYRRLEPLLYALTRRPNYYPYIRNRATGEALRSRLEHAGLPVVEMRYLGRTFGLSPLLRPVGLQRWSENLLVTVSRKPGTLPPQSHKP